MNPEAETYLTLSRSINQNVPHLALSHKMVYFIRQLNRLREVNVLLNGLECMRN